LGYSRGIWGRFSKGALGAPLGKFPAGFFYPFLFWGKMGGYIFLILAL